MELNLTSSLFVQADQFLDSAMTYTLFEWVKENYDDLIADQLNIPQVVTQVGPLKHYCISRLLFLLCCMHIHNIFYIQNGGMRQYT